MPWKVFKRDGKYQVFKVDAAGEPTGDALGTHDSEDKARQQQQALYASESKKAIAVKAVDGSEDEIEGYGMPFGGPFNGSDVQGERFSAKTDFAFDWFSERPLIYQHGLDAPGTSVVGRVKTWESQDDGVWVKAQLDRGNKYFGAIKRLIDQSGLYFSSGSMNHLAKVDKSGEITRWPWIELSLTPTPANPIATLDFATAKAHLKAAGLDLPDEDALKAKLDAAALQNLSPSDFAYIDSEGGKHLPMHDAVHARNALARFDQTTFESAAAKETARKKLITRCKELGIEVSPEMMGSKSVGLISLIDLLLEDDIPDLDAVPLVAHAEAVKTLAALFVARTKDLRERRTKEGRILSTANRSRLDSCVESMRNVCDEMQALLDSTQPPAKAGDVRRRVQAQMQALKLRALSLS